MIESARFTNINGMYVDFNTNDIPFNQFTTTVDLRFSEKARSQQHGIFQSKTYFGKRLFHAEGDVFADNSAQYISRRLAMVGALMPRPELGQAKAGDLSVLFSGMAEALTSECTIDGYPELPMNGASPARTPYQVNFKSFDPRLYGAWQTVDLPYGIVGNAGGRTYNKTYNKTYAAITGAGADVVITNSGNFDSYPLITMYGPITDPRITFSRSDGAVAYFTLLGLNLPSIADYAVVDMQKRTVILGNGSNAYNYALGSDWVSLQPSPLINYVRYTGSTGASPAHALFQWRNAYML